jgi:hypothetical protein
MTKYVGRPGPLLRSRLQDGVAGDGKDAVRGADLGLERSVDGGRARGAETDARFDDDRPGALLLAPDLRSPRADEAEATVDLLEGQVDLEDAGSVRRRPVSGRSEHRSEARRPTCTTPSVPSPWP